MRLDTIDEKILTALDGSFVVDDNKEVATLSGPITITMIRTAEDILELLIQFGNIDFPIKMLRSQTLKSLGIKDAQDGV